MTTWIGIDPGLSGGIAAVTHDGPQIHPMPETERDQLELLRTIAHWSDSRFCVIEAVHSFPGQGVASSFTFGRGYGGLRMALHAMEIPFEVVAPRVWQKALGVLPRGEKTKGEHKLALKRKAQELFPKLHVTLKTCDALLLAEYCRRTRAMVEVET
jgi:crossover junction endodeoxyribonuclease RuvC